MKENKLEVKITTKEISQIESDGTLFSLFDFLLTDKPQTIDEKKVGNDKKQIWINTEIKK